MSTFAFETITAPQAFAITPSDAITVSAATGTATGVTVNYLLSATGAITTVNISFGAGQPLPFGLGIAGVSQQPGHVSFDDGSVLYIGDNGFNTFDSATSATPARAPIPRPSAPAGPTRSAPTAPTTCCRATWATTC